MMTVTAVPDPLLRCGLSHHVEELSYEVTQYFATTGRKAPVRLL